MRATPTPRRGAALLVLLLLAAARGGRARRPCPGRCRPSPRSTRAPRPRSSPCPRSPRPSRAAVTLVEAGDPAEAAALIDALAAAHPEIGTIPLMQAELAMLAGDPAAALAALEARRGPRRRPPPDPRGSRCFAPLAVRPARSRRSPPARPPPPPPAPRPGRGRRRPRPGLRRPTPPGTPPRSGWPRASPSPPSPTPPVLPPRPKTAALEILREHWRRGRAAGNHGDLYDNRDRGHSTLDPAAAPAARPRRLRPAARAADLDYGLADRLLFDAPDPRQLLDGDHRRRALALAAARGADRAPTAPARSGSGRTRR